MLVKKFKVSEYRYKIRNYSRRAKIRTSVTIHQNHGARLDEGREKNSFLSRGSAYPTTMASKCNLQRFKIPCTEEEATTDTTFQRISTSMMQ